MKIPYPKITWLVYGLKKTLRDWRFARAVDRASREFRARQPWIRKVKEVTRDLRKNKSKETDELELERELREIVCYRKFGVIDLWENLHPEIV